MVTNDLSKNSNQDMKTFLRRHVTQSESDVFWIAPSLLTFLSSFGEPETFLNTKVFLEHFACVCEYLF